MPAPLWALLVSSLATISSISAAEGDAFDAAAAIRESAERLCPSTTPGAGPAAVKRVKRLEMYSRGFQYDTYEVTRATPVPAEHATPPAPGTRATLPDPATRPSPPVPVGRASLVAQSQEITPRRLTRLQIFARRGSTIDLVASHDSTSLTTLQALRPLVLSGGAFPGLPRLASQLRGKPIEAYASGLARLFRALPAAAAFAASDKNAAARPLAWTQYEGTQRPAGTPAPVVRLWQKQLPLGSLLPALTPDAPAGGQSNSSAGSPGKPGASAGLAGPARADATLAGREVAVLFGDIGDSVCRGMVRGFALAAARRPDLSVVAVLAGPPEKVALWAKETTELAGKLPRLVPDPRKTLWKSFLPPLLPYFFLFDKKHRLVHKSFWAGPENLQRELLARLEPK